MNTVEYVKYWAKLHDVNFSVEQRAIAIDVKFNDSNLCIWDDATRDQIKSGLYDLVYGTRDKCPDTERL